LEQLSARRREIVVLRFQEAMAFFELIVLVNGVEINRAYVVELARQIGNHLWQIGAGRIDIASWRDLLALQLQTQGFFERDLVRCELTQIDSITAGGVFGEVVDLQLSLGLGEPALPAPIL